MATLDVLVGRQPIFTRDGRVVGHELLFRPVADTDGGGLDGDLLTSTVVFSAAAIGVDRLVGDKLAFVNADRGVLTGEVPLLLPPGRTVVEILETVAPDDEVLAGCRQLRERGYELALDDFEWFDGAERLLELASVVKIDLRKVPPGEVPALVRRCRQFPVKVLAEKVESHEELSRCKELGFDLFQGYLLSRPQLVPGRTLDATAVSHLQLAAALVEQEFDLQELERIMRTDPSLTVQLLQLAGMGGAHGLRRDIRTLREALVMLGWRQLQSWVAFLVLMQHGRSSEEQASVALTRARMAELLAGRMDRRSASMAFTAGMLSALDLLLGLPLEEVLAQLPLAGDLHAAALGQGDGLGRIVRAVVDHGAGRDGAELAGFGRAELDRAAGEALTWAMQAAVRPAA